MGLSGLTLVWHQSALVFGTPSIIATTLAAITAAVFVVLAIAYGAKILRHFGAVRAELNHPVKLSFVPAISISLILMGTALRHVAPMLAHGLWVVGTAAHLLLMLFVVGRWMHHEHFEVNHISPAWFIPAVGNILVPIAGVGFGYSMVSWFFFSIGLVFWIVLLTIVFYRVFFHAPLPARLLPTLFIMIAPPAAGFIAWVQLAGGLDALGRILVNIALFLTLLLITQAPRFARLQFFLSFWAYSFPMAAMTVAVLLYYELTGAPMLLWLGGGFVAITTALIAWLIFLTVRAASRGQICVPEG